MASACCWSSSEGAAAALAEELDRENQARQEIEREIVEQATAQAEERIASGARGLVLAEERWHPGVVGIVASRIVERFHRPAVLIGVSHGEGKGSGQEHRGLPPLRRAGALRGAPLALRRAPPRGGPEHRSGGDPRLPRALRGLRAALGSSDDDLVPRCRIEGRLGPAQVSERAASALERLAPYGAGHPEPLFALRGRPRRARTVGAAGVHLKLAFGPGVDAIGFSMGERVGLCAGEVEAAVTLGFDDWDGLRRVQLEDPRS